MLAGIARRRGARPFLGVAVGRSGTRSTDRRKAVPVRVADFELSAATVECRRLANRVFASPTRSVAERARCADFGLLPTVASVPALLEHRSGAAKRSRSTIGLIAPSPLGIAQARARAAFGELPAQAVRAAPEQVLPAALGLAGAARCRGAIPLARVAVGLAFTGFERKKAAPLGAADLEHRAATSVLVRLTDRRAATGGVGIAECRRSANLEVYPAAAFRSTTLEHGACALLRARRAGPVCVGGATRSVRARRARRPNGRHAGASTRNFARIGTVFARTRIVADLEISAGNDWRRQQRCQKHDVQGTREFLHSRAHQNRPFAPIVPAPT